MKMITQDAEIELVSLTHSINKDPESWEGWMCLHISLPRQSPYNDDSHSMTCVRALLESCLKDVEGNSFFCEHDDVFTICKNVSYSVLREVGQHVCDLVLDGELYSSDFKIFDLAHNGSGFVDYYCKKGERFTIFSLPQACPNQNHMHPDAIFLPKAAQISQNPESRKDTKVLLVEDDPVTRWMVRNTLRAKCQLVTAQNGNKALSLYKSYQPDIVFLDINLPDIDGLSVLDWIMRHDPGAYVVMFSSEAHLDTIVSTLEDGAKGFVAKPFRKEQLIHYLESCPTAH